MKLTNMFRFCCVSVLFALTGACDPAIEGDDPKALDAAALAEEEVLAEMALAEGSTGEALAVDDGANEWTPDESLALADAADPSAICVYYPIAYDVWGPDVCGSCTLNGAPAAESWVFMKNCSSCGGCGAPYIRDVCQPC